jgi:hypothetical protein
VPGQPITRGPTTFVVAPLCSACGQPAEKLGADFGIGGYEFWGVPGVDVHWRTVSDCCEAPLMENAAGNVAKLRNPRRIT